MSVVSALGQVGGLVSAGGPSRPEMAKRGGGIIELRLASTAKLTQVVASDVRAPAAVIAYIDSSSSVEMLSVLATTPSCNVSWIEAQTSGALLSSVSSAAASRTMSLRDVRVRAAEPCATAHRTPDDPHPIHGLAVRTCADAAAGDAERTPGTALCGAQTVCTDVPIVPDADSGSDGESDGLTVMSSPHCACRDGAYPLPSAPNAELAPYSGSLGCVLPIAVERLTRVSTTEALVSLDKTQDQVRVAWRWLRHGSGRPGMALPSYGPPFRWPSVVLSSVWSLPLCGALLRVVPSDWPYVGTARLTLRLAGGREDV